MAIPKEPDKSSKAEEKEFIIGKKDLLITSDTSGRTIADVYRISAARWVAIAILPTVALTALGVLVYYPQNPPSWAQPALFSILTAAVAFLFNDRFAGDPIEQQRRRTR